MQYSASTGALSSRSNSETSWQAPSASDDESSIMSSGFEEEDQKLDCFKPPAFYIGDSLAQNGLCSSASGLRKSSTDSNLITAAGYNTGAHLKILRQPEEQHRARYMSEGSRGAIKDRSGKSHCTVQLVGYNRPTRLEVYAGTCTDPLAPHPLYRVIPVVGKGGASLTTPCHETISKEGRNCIELMLRPENRMTAVLDCLGILKICSHDTKKRMPKATKNACIRLVFRASIPHPADPTQDLVLRAVSTPISCIQQLGFPEVQKISLRSASARGGTDLFIIGRNFDKNTTVVFREYNADGRLIWTSEAAMDHKCLHQCHLVCAIPTYRDLNLTEPVEVTMTIECGKKQSHPLNFSFLPVSESACPTPTRHTPPDWQPIDEDWDSNSTITRFSTNGNCSETGISMQRLASTDSQGDNMDSANLSSIIQMLETPQLDLPLRRAYSDESTNNYYYNGQSSSSSQSHFLSSSDDLDAEPHDKCLCSEFELGLAVAQSSADWNTRNNL